MQFTAVTLFTLAVAGYTAAQGGNCQDTYNGKFQIAVFQAASKRDLQPRADCSSSSGALVISLNGGKLLDQNGRIGYVASNDQFQFDNPVQNGAKETQGFAVCDNQFLSLTGSEDFYRCLSGSFYNLYFHGQTAEQCQKVRIGIVPCDGSAPPPTGSSSSGGSSSPATYPTTGASSYSSPAASTPVITTSPKPSAIISQGTNGQPQVPTSAPPVSQTSSGQPQTHTSKPPGPVATGAAANLHMGAEVAAAFAGIAAIAML